LFISNLGADYGEYMVVKGLVDLLGGEKVVVWPFKKTYVGEVDHYPERTVGDKRYFDSGASWSEKWTDPKLYRAWEPSRFPEVPVSNDGPLAFSEKLPLTPWTFEQIEKALYSGEISTVIMGSVRWHSSIAWKEFLDKAGQRQLPKLILLDNEDYYQLRWDYVHEYKPAIYFKRTLVLEGNPRSDTWNNDVKVPIRPLPFSSLWDVPWKPWNERKWDLMCVFGATQILRQKVKETVVEVASEFPALKLYAQVGHPMNHAQWLEALADSKIVIDHQRMGTDTVRFWEATSSGACVVSDLHLGMEPSLIPGVHFAQYDRDMSAEGDKQVFDGFRTTLRGLLSDLSAAEKIARAGYDEVRANHTAKAHAKYILQQAQGVGVNIGGLL
jgi:hypothetical protein